MTTLQPPPATPCRHRDVRQATWRYLRALGAGADEADDLVQEVMLVALQGALPDEPARAEAFLRGVARNQWLRTRRWWQRRREREIAAAVDELWVQTAARDAGQALLVQLDACLDKLERRTRAALERHYRDGVAWDEIAAELGLLPNGIKTLAQRARQALRRCIERSSA